MSFRMPKASCTAAAARREVAGRAAIRRGRGEDAAVANVDRGGAGSASDRSTTNCQLPTPKESRSIQPAERRATSRLLRLPPGCFEGFPLGVGSWELVVDMALPRVAIT